VAAPAWRDNCLQWVRGESIGEFRIVLPRESLSASNKVFPLS